MTNYKLILFGSGFILFAILFAASMIHTVKNTAERNDVISERIFICQQLGYNGLSSDGRCIKEHYTVDNESLYRSYVEVDFEEYKRNYRE